LLTESWLTVSNAANVDPYEMDLSAIAASPQGRYFAVAGCSKPLEADLRSGNTYCDGEQAQSTEGLPFLLILDTMTENVIGMVPEIEAGTTIADLSFTHDGEKLIYAVHPGRFAIWDVGSSQVESILWEGETSMPRIAVSPDGKWIALKPADQVLVWDTALEEFVAELPGYFRPQFSADSTRLLIYRDGQFIFYETGTWTELLRFDVPCDCVYAFSPDLSLFALSERVASENAPIVIWDMATGDQVQSLVGNEGPTVFLLFSPDGKMLWRAAQHGDLQAWRTSDWQLLADHIGGFMPIFNLRDFQFVDDGRHYFLLSDRHFGVYGLP
jgi:WD40 repeat protein